MSRNRNTKQAAGRVDPGYVKGKRKLRRLTYGLVLALSLLAFGWWGIRQVRGDKTLESPGHLAGVHALWENDCGQCHLPNPKGKGFILNEVKDNACLKCHDGPIHDVNQKTLIPASRAGTAHGCTGSDAQATGVKDEKTCIQCHTEHRGLDALLAKGDTRCVQCHDNLFPKYACQPPKVKPDVQYFWATTGAGAHPSFGRDLILPVALPSPDPVTGEKYVRKYGTGTRLIDPTPLKFNHKDHLTTSPRPAVTAENCGTCHQQASPSLIAGQRPDRRYMQPVSYQEHCAECHSLKFPNTDIAVPHESLERLQPLARDIAKNLEGYYARSLDAMSPQDRKAALTKKKGTRVTTITPDVWAKGQADAAWQKMLTDLFTSPAPELTAAAPDVAKAAKEAVDSGADAAVASKGIQDARVVSYLIARDAAGCIKCHVMSDEPKAAELLVKLAGAPMAPSVVNELKKHAAAAPADASGAGPSTPAYTLPTGMTGAPRRWFVNSVFDHDAHRMKETSCLRCHGDIMTTDAGRKAAVEVPIENDPDLTDPSTLDNRLNGKDTGKVAMPTLQSCVECHYKPTAANPGAGASCQLCHVFHDRSKEVPVFGPNPSVAAAPAPAATPPAAP